jgi:hypothetical protein
MSGIGHLMMSLCRLAVLVAGEGDAVPVDVHDPVMVVNGLTFTDCTGDPETLGTTMGRARATQVTHLLSGMSRLIPTASPRLTQLAEHIPSAYQRELNALAQAAHVDPTLLTRMNLVVDTLCSAAVHLPDAAMHRPLVVGRNLDFGGADLLGAGTVIAILRATGKHVVASIGWPGYTGVVSGINDAGVTACILLNRHAESAGLTMGTPLGYRVRALLEDCATCDEAITAFGASPVGSDNFVVIADATHAAVVWQTGPTTTLRVDPKDLWLFCTNAPEVAALGGPTDARGQCLRTLAAAAPTADAIWMHTALAAVYLTSQNAQSMVFIPAERRLHLATGSAGRAAALSVWRDVDLTALFAGGAIQNAVVTVLGPLATVPRHYR